MVRSHINRFDQLEAMSKIQKPLREVTDFPLRKDSAIYERVQSFERIGRDNQIERQLNLGGLNRRWQGSEEDTFPDEVPAAPVPVLFTM